MGYFPLCMELKNRHVLLVGNGPQIREKMNRLQPFGCVMRHVDTICAEDLTEDVAFVVVGDTSYSEAAGICTLCRACRIPVNVVDQPELCSFFFPAMVSRGDLTVSVSTGGRSPGTAACLAARFGRQLPDRTEEILDWLHEMRISLYRQFPQEEARALLRKITRQAFDLGRPLQDEEIIKFD